MNVVNRLTVRQLKLNKRRTLVTLLGVIISVAMITAVAALGTSVMDLLQRGAIADSGNWHVLYKEVTPEQLKAVVADKNSDQVSLSRDVGYALLAGSKNLDKPYLFVRELNEVGFDNFPIALKEGRLPSAANELVVSEQAGSQGKIKVGDTLRPALGERVATGGDSKEQAQSELSQNQSLQWDDAGKIVETLKPALTRTYTVVGVIDRPSWEPTWAPGYTALSYVDESTLQAGDKVNASVAVKKVNRSIFKHADDMAKRVGIGKAQFNSQLLRFYGVTNEDSFQTTLYSFISIIMAIILIGSVSLIYNAFAISVSERSRQLGMLSSVGATRKQKKRSVLFEGGIIGLISIPLGIVAGLAGIGITFTFINPLFRDFSPTHTEFKLVVSPASLLLAVAVSIVTIYISTYNPARRAARISAMDAIRQTQDIRLTGKSVKTSLLTRRIFGFEAEIGLKNLKRNRRRYRATVFSLIVSLVLFLSVSTFTYYLGKSVAMSQSSCNYDIEVHRAVRTDSGAGTDSGLKPKATAGIFEQIAAMDKVKDSSIVYQFDTTLQATSNQATDELKKSAAVQGKPSAVSYLYTVRLIGLTDEAFDRYAGEIGADPQRFRDKAKPSAILIDTASYRERKSGKFVKAKAIYLKQGESLPLTAFDEKRNGTTPLVDLTAAHLTDKLPLGISQEENPGLVNAVLPLSAWTPLAHKASGTDIIQPKLYLTSADPIGLQSDIEKWKSDTGRVDINLWNVYKSRQQDRNLLLIVNIFAYGFVSLITAVSIANIFNTISTSIALRKREFAMLRSVGMTPQGFNRMIRFESLFYGIKTLLYGLPISFAVMLLLYTALSGSFSFVFSIPWSSVAFAVGSVFLIVGASMLYSGAKVRRENILDGLRTENI